MKSLNTYINLLLCTILTIGITSCATNEKTASTKRPKKENSSINSNTVEVDQAQLDLESYLRRVPGVTVSAGNIKIRSTTSAVVDSTPLFVLDGVVIGNSFDRVKSLVVVNDIKNVRILKSGGEAAAYGTQGSNGVIMITTKKNGRDEN